MLFSKLFKDSKYISKRSQPIDYITKDNTKIEIKKTASLTSFEFNSSYPDKDVLYILGYVVNSKIKQLTFIYGDFWFNSFDYKKLSETIKDSVANTCYSNK